MVMRDRFRVENVKARGSAGDVNTLAVIGNGQGMKHVVLPILKISCVAGSIPDSAEIRESAFRK